MSGPPSGLLPEQHLQALKLPTVLREERTKREVPLNTLAQRAERTG